MGTHGWSSAIVSITMAFAACFSLLGGLVNARFGRRLTTGAASMLFIAGTLMISFAYEKVWLLLGRATLGMAIGLASMTAPMYIAECAPANIRGRLVTLNNVSITFGQLTASVIDGGFSKTTQGWRYMFGLVLIPATIQAIGFAFVLPDSPRWLVERNRIEEARAALRRIRETAYDEQELTEIKEAAQAAQ